MQERIYLGLRYIRICLAVVLRIEQGMRASSFQRSMLHEMKKGVDSSRCDIEVTFQIPGDVENRMRIPALGNAVQKKVLPRIESTSQDIQIAVQIPFAIEEHR